jgi:hypothetical protein
MSQNDDEYDVTDSDQNVEGDIGVSSERVGHTGPGQQAPTGVRDTREIEPDDDQPPEQSAGGDEVQPDGLEPKAGYPSLDPRSD